MGREESRRIGAIWAKVIEITIMLISVGCSAYALYGLSLFWWPESSLLSILLIGVVIAIPLAITMEIYATLLKPKSQFLRINGFLFLQKEKSKDLGFGP